jgi:hypothetical protein
MGTKSQQIKASIKKKVESIDPAQRCLSRIEKILQEEDCVLAVDFVTDSVMGQNVLRYNPMVVYKGK